MVQAVCKLVSLYSIFVPISLIAELNLKLLAMRGALAAGQPRTELEDGIKRRRVEGPGNLRVAFLSAEAPT